MPSRETVPIVRAGAPAHNPDMVGPIPGPQGPGRPYRAAPIAGVMCLQMPDQDEVHIALLHPDNLPIPDLVIPDQATRDRVAIREEIPDIGEATAERHREDRAIAPEVIPDLPAVTEALVASGPQEEVSEARAEPCAQAEDAPEEAEVGNRLKVH